MRRTTRSQRAQVVIAGVFYGYSSIMLSMLPRALYKNSTVDAAMYLGVKASIASHAAGNDIVQAPHKVRTPGSIRRARGCGLHGAADQTARRTGVHFDVRLTPRCTRVAQKATRWTDSQY